MNYIANDATAQPPEDLRKRNQWLTYKLKQKPDGGLDKVPTDPGGGTPQDRNGFNLTYEQAHSAVQRSHHVHGVGFNLTDRDPLACIDLDKCRDPETGSIAEWALRIVQLFDSYAEVSVSGTGVHVFVYGVVVGKTRPEVLGHSIETYSRDRFIAVTGQHLRGTPADVRDAQHVLAAIGRDNPHRHSAVPATGPGNGLDDAEVLDSARAAANGEEFARLYDQGDISGYQGDQSRADLALASRLLFWTGGDREQTTRLMLGSALYRDKFDREDYIPRTLDKALAGKGPEDFYQASLSPSLISQGRKLGFHTCC